MFNNETIKDIENKIGYTFKDKKLLEQCFTHSSYAKLEMHNRKVEDNERLEFFGDAILGFIVSESLYSNENDDQGEMTIRRQRFVSATSLDIVVERLDIAKYILFAGKNKENLGKKAISSLYEALCAGIYLDGGIDVVRTFILSTLKDVERKADINYKGILQEKVQNSSNEIIKYEVLYEYGPDNAPVYEVEVRVGKYKGVGKGSNKKEAEQEAAKNILTKLGG